MTGVMQDTSRGRGLQAFKPGRMGRSLPQAVYLSTLVAKYLSPQCSPVRVFSELSHRWLLILDCSRSSGLWVTQIPPKTGL